MNSNKLCSEYAMKMCMFIQQILNMAYNPTNKTLTGYWCNVGSVSQRVVQDYANIGISLSRDCWDTTVGPGSTYGH